MAGGLPKLLDKAFAIGFFAPALLAVLVAAWIFPGVTVLNPVRDLSASEKSLTDLTYVVLIVWTVAILLMTANHGLYRMLEGYLPPVSWMRPLIWWHRRRFNRLKHQYEALILKWQTAIDCDEKFPQDAQDRASAIRRTLLSRYPSNEAEVMPTRFGNIIRSFEVYPREVYGADSVPLWLRLASVVPKDFAGLLDDARAQANFFVNLMYISLLIAIISPVNALYEANWHKILNWSALEPDLLRHGVTPAIALIVSCVSYSWANARVMAWGDLVKSAFDCYLTALIKQLGFAIPPTEAERKEFWQEFSALVTYQQQMTRPWPVATETGSGKEAKGDAEAKSDDEAKTNNEGGESTAEAEEAVSCATASNSAA